MFAENLSAEKSIEAAVEGSTLTLWECPAHTDNHFFDNVVGCFVAASVLGAARPGQKQKRSRTRRRKGRGGNKRMSLKERFEAQQKSV